MIPAKYLVVLTVSVVVVVSLFVFGVIPPSAYAPASQTTSSQNFFISLTDPATVPPGTTALYVTYSALQMSVSRNGAVSIQSLPGTGTVNVLDLQNNTIVLAATNLPNGSVVTKVKMNISNAVITIKGRNSTVVIGESGITANISASAAISGKQSALVDLIPSVTAIETTDKTIYVLTPSVKAVIAPISVFVQPSSNISSKRLSIPAVGNRLRFASNISVPQIFHSVTPTVNVTLASINVNGNDTNLAITLKNTGNSSVQLNGIMLNGSKKIYIPMPPANLMFRMPATTLVLPPPVLGGIGGPIFRITFPNGTVMNTTSYINVGLISGNQSSPPAITGHFYILKLLKPAYAISFNFSSALLNISGDEVIETSTIPNQTAPLPGQTVQNMTIPPNSTIVDLPLGTTLGIHFPKNISVSEPQPVPTAQMQEMPIGRMIFPNGTIGFPSMSFINSLNNSLSTNQVSNLLSSGVTNLNTSINPAEIPRGYILSPGASVTLTLNGQLSLGPSIQVPGPSGNEFISSPFAVLIPGASYTVGIFGISGVEVYTKITAS